MSGALWYVSHLSDSRLWLTTKGVLTGERAGHRFISWLTFPLLMKRRNRSGWVLHPPRTNEDTIIRLRVRRKPPPSS